MWANWKAITRARPLYRKINNKKQWTTTSTKKKKKNVKTNCAKFVLSTLHISTNYNLTRSQYVMDQGKNVIFFKFMEFSSKIKFFLNSHYIYTTGIHIYTHSHEMSNKSDGWYFFLIKNFFFLKKSFWLLPLRNSVWCYSARLNIICIRARAIHKKNTGKTFIWVCAGDESYLPHNIRVFLFIKFFVVKKRFFI